MQANRLARLSSASAVFFECDIQSKLESHLFNFPTLARNAARLTQTAQILEIPVISTTQVNLGPISTEISDKHFAGVRVFEGKKSFSMMTPEVDEHFRALNRQ